MAICNECSSQFRSITNTHLTKHNISLAEYQIKYPDSEIRDVEVKEMMYKNHSQMMSKLRRDGTIVSKPLSAKCREEARQRMLNNNPMKHAEVVDKVRQTRAKRFKAGLYDLSRSEEARRNYSMSKLGDKNPMKRPEVYMKNAMAHNRKKSGIEILFDKIIKEYKLPLKYVGNNKLWVGGKNPDYVMEGKKVLIEVTSDAYKRLETGYELDRIKHFKEHGYETITVRYTHCLVKDRDKRHHSIGKLLTKLLYENSSYQVYHSKTGEITSVQFRD